MHAYRHTDIHTYLHTYVPTYPHFTYLHTYLHTYLPTYITWHCITLHLAFHCIHIVYICMYIFIYIYIFVCVCPLWALYALYGGVVSARSQIGGTFGLWTFGAWTLGNSRRCPFLEKTDSSLCRGSAGKRSGTTHRHGWLCLCFGGFKLFQWFYSWYSWGGKVIQYSSMVFFILCDGCSDVSTSARLMRECIWLSCWRPVGNGVRHWKCTESCTICQTWSIMPTSWHASLTGSCFWRPMGRSMKRSKCWRRSCNRALRLWEM